MHSKDLVVLVNGGFYPPKENDIRERVAYVICHKDNLRKCLKDLIFDIYITDRPEAQNHFDGYATSTITEIIGDLIDDMDEDSILEYLFMANFAIYGYHEWLEVRFPDDVILRDKIKKQWENIEIPQVKDDFSMFHRELNLVETQEKIEKTFGGAR